MLSRRLGHSKRRRKSNFEANRRARGCPGSHPSGDLALPALVPGWGLCPSGLVWLRLPLHLPLRWETITLAASCTLRLQEVNAVGRNWLRTQLLSRAPLTALTTQRSRSRWIARQKQEASLQTSSLFTRCSQRRCLERYPRSLARHVVTSARRHDAGEHTASHPLRSPIRSSPPRTTVSMLSIETGDSVPATRSVQQSHGRDISARRWRLRCQSNTPETSSSERTGSLNSQRPPSATEARPARLHYLIARSQKWDRTAKLDPSVGFWHPAPARNMQCGLHAIERTGLVRVSKQQVAASYSLGSPTNTTLCSSGLDQPSRALSDDV